MAESKLEVLFVVTDETPKGYRVLGSFSVDGPMPTLILPQIGETISVDLDDKKFVGRVFSKLIEYSQQDMAGKVWSFVTRIIITLDEIHETTELRDVT
jgi:hypothetical protein